MYIKKCTSAHSKMLLLLFYLTVYMSVLELILKFGSETVFIFLSSDL